MIPEDADPIEDDAIEPEDDTSSFTLDATIKRKDGTTATVTVTVEYPAADPLAALHALYQLGRPDSLEQVGMGLSAAYDDLEEADQ